MNLLNSWPSSLCGPRLEEAGAIRLAFAHLALMRERISIRNFYFYNKIKSGMIEKICLR